MKISINNILQDMPNDLTNIEYIYLYKNDETR